MKNVLLHALVGSTVILGVASTASADANPGANAVQAKYMTRTGVRGSMCAPSGTLKDFVSGKYQCSGLSGGDSCGASLDAAKGKLDAKFVDLMVDLTKRDATIAATDGNRDNNLYAGGCTDVGGADYIHQLSPSVLSYAKSSPEALFAMGTSESFTRWGAAEREDYIAAIGRYGAPQQAKILPILKTALATKGSMLAFKKNALKLMARFGSDDGVAYCNDVLKQGNDKDVTQACARYFGERKTTAAASTLVRRLEEERETFTRALGLIGSAEAIAALKADYEKSLGSSNALRSTVALLNLGDKSHDYAGDLASLIQGRRPLSTRERDRKAEELKSKKAKGVAEKWKTREAESDEQIAREAAIEATYATAGTAKVTAALQAVAKRTDWPKAAAMATSALAQRGDAAATASLVALLSSPKEDVRAIAVNAFGASYDDADAFPSYVGRKGVVSDATALPALAAYIDNEPKPERRAKALHALGAVRSFLP